MLHVFILFTLTYPEQQSLHEIVKEKLLDLKLQISLKYLLVKSYLTIRVDWLGTWHRLDQKRIFILGKI
jgi:hypothetical protein